MRQAGNERALGIESALTDALLERDAERLESLGLERRFRRQMRDLDWL